LLGTVAYGESEFYRIPHNKFGAQSEFSVDGITALPRVDIVYGCTDMPADLIDASVERGAKGIIIAGVGNGNMTKAALEACARASKKGVVVVRSSRVATGNVGRNVEVDDDKLGLVASYDLNPQKARILLTVALAKPRKMDEIQNLFYQY
jgi:L-asparaginase